MCDIPSDSEPQTNNLPKGLDECDPNSRTFPTSWKESYYSRHFNRKSGGYICPICKKIFKGTSGFHQLHGDHIIPVSKGGLTLWNNLQLLCGKCNQSKK
ncbi:MAG: HNH endonuclease [Magnetococcales bacterium]|nr:HNH endonuclease [Magnetococcales bacterium]